MAHQYTRRLVMALALAAGLPFGLFTEVLPAFMYQQGLSLTVIGSMGWTQLPWALKPLWAPWADRSLGPARWLGGASLGLGGAYLALALLAAQAPLPLWGLALALTLLATSAASQDLVADAFFVRLHQRSPFAREQLSGLRTAAYKVAVMGGSALLLLTASGLGWRVTLVALAGMTIVWGQLLAGAMTRLSAAEAAPTEAQRARRPAAGARGDSPRAPLAPFLRQLRRWLASQDLPACLVFCLLYKLGLCCLAPMAKPFWLDRGVSSLHLGLAAWMSLAGAMTGIALAGLLPRVLRWPALLALGSLAEALVAGLYAAGSLLSDAFGPLGALYPTVLAEGMAQGMTTTLLVTVMAGLCDRDQVATQFAVLSASFALTRAVGSQLGGALASVLGWPLFFAVTPLLCLPSLLFVGAVHRRLSAVAQGPAAGT